MLWESSKMEQRYDAVVGVIRDGLTVTEVARKFGVSRQSVCTWLARHEAGGLDAQGASDATIEARANDTSSSPPELGCG
jgi:transposase